MLKFTRSCEAMLLSMATFVTISVERNTLSSTKNSNAMKTTAMIERTDPCSVASVKSAGILM